MTIVLLSLLIFVQACAEIVMSDLLHFWVNGSFIFDWGYWEGSLLLHLATLPGQRATGDGEGQVVYELLGVERSEAGVVDSSDKTPGWDHVAVVIHLRTRSQHHEVGKSVIRWAPFKNALALLKSKLLFLHSGLWDKWLKLENSHGGIPLYSIEEISLKCTPTRRSFRRGSMN